MVYLKITRFCAYNFKAGINTEHEICACTGQCAHDSSHVHVGERQREAESLGVWFHPCGLGQEAASMLGNEVTGQSVNTHGSHRPWPGGRLSHCSENGNVNKINLPAFWPLCGSTG